MEKEQQPLRIDVRTVIRSKSPALERFLPGFAIRYLERILHQDEFNFILSTFGHLPGIAMAKTTLEHYGVTSTPHGLEHIPLDGRYIFVSNHPLGGLDGSVLISVIGTLFGSVKFIVNDILIHFKPFEDIFVPVNKHGRQSQEYAQLITQAYDSDAQMLYFPAGICSRKIKGKITDLPWKRNFLLKAINHQRDIVPVFFSGQNSNFFYRLANFRKRLHIPINFEMFYLSDEMFRQKGAHFDLYFGAPIPYTHFTKEKTPDQWVADIRTQLYNLPNSIPKPPQPDSATSPT